jgi:hypothetical protein
MEKFNEEDEKFHQEILKIKTEQDLKKEAYIFGIKPIKKLSYFFYGFSLICVIFLIISLLFLRNREGFNLLLFIYIPGSLIFAILGFFSEKIVTWFSKLKK